MMKNVIEVYMEIARNNPPWTPVEEKAFIASCTTKTGKWRSNAMKDRFVNDAMKHNLGLVFSIVNKLAFNKTEDVVQKAILGMVEALKKYDPKKGRKISTWITNPIRWAILQHQNTYAKSGTIADELAALNHRYKMDLRVVSVDFPIGHEEDKETIGDFITPNMLDRNYVIDRNIKTESERLADADIEDGVQELMKKLPTFLNEKEVYVIKGVLKGQTQTDISVEMKLSKVRVSQLQASAFDKIRKSPMSRTLRKLIA